MSKQALVRLALTLILCLAVIGASPLVAIDLGAPTVQQAASAADVADLSPQADSSVIGPRISEPSLRFLSTPDDWTPCTDYCNEVCAPWGGIQASACRQSPAPPHNYHSICCCLVPDNNCAPWEGGWPQP